MSGARSHVSFFPDTSHLRTDTSPFHKPPPCIRLARHYLGKQADEEILHADPHKVAGEPRSSGPQRPPSSGPLNKEVTTSDHLAALLRVTVRASLLALLLSTLGAGSLGCRRRPPPPQAYVAFIVNHQSSTLAAVSLADFRVVASLPVTPQPEQIVVRPGHQELYVLSATGKVSVVAYPHPQVIATLNVGRSAQDLQFSPDGRSAYVADPADGDVVFLDCEPPARNPTPAQSGQPGFPIVTSRTHVSGGASGLALTPDGKALVVESGELNRLTFLSTQTRKPLGEVEVGKTPGPLVVLPDNSKVFVADTGEEKISAVDVATRKLLSHIEIGTLPTALFVKPDGGEIFVLSAKSTSLVIVDAFHDNVEQTFPTGREPAMAVFRRDSSILYLANAGDGSVMVLDVGNQAVLTSTHVGVEPRALALTPDERFLVVADSATSSVAILRADPTSLGSNRSMLITTVQVGTQPVDVVIPDWLGK